MTSGILSLFITIILSLSQVWCAHPNVFVPVSNATCQPEYAWMNNAEQKSPCLTVAYVLAACVGDTWTQPALPSGSSYDSPNGTTATPCYCSWACYNLMMACTLCQNPAYMSEIRTWPAFSQNCPSNYNQMFPKGYVLADNISIPYWATINPMDWSYELFDIGQAGTYANQNRPDYWPSELISSPSPSSSSNPTSNSSRSSLNIGAIIGGAIGGAVGLSIVLIRCYFLRKRRQYQRLHNPDGATPIPYTGIPMTDIHAPWPSDPSMAFPQVPPNSRPVSYPVTRRKGMNPGIPAPSPPPLYSSVQVTSPPPADNGSFLTTENIAAQRTHTTPMV